MPGRNETGQKSEFVSDSGTQPEPWANIGYNRFGSRRNISPPCAPGVLLLENIRNVSSRFESSVALSMNHFGAPAASSRAVGTCQRVQSQRLCRLRRSGHALAARPAAMRITFFPYYLLLGIKVACLILRLRLFFIQWPPASRRGDRTWQVSRAAQSSIEALLPWAYSHSQRGHLTRSPSMIPKFLKRQPLVQRAAIDRPRIWQSAGECLPTAGIVFKKP